jgi:hypothetical protein
MLLNRQAYGGEQMKRFLNLHVLAVGLVLVAGLIVLFISRGAFQKPPIIQQSPPAAQSFLSSPSIAYVAKPAPLGACEQCLQSCLKNSPYASDTPGDSADQRREDACQIQCSDKCGDSGGGKGKTRKRLAIKQRP